MSEEKKLDEKKLEEVTGGTSTASFYMQNCRSCRRNATPNCYYHGPTLAVETLGSSGTCSYKEAM